MDTSQPPRIGNILVQLRIGSTPLPGSQVFPSFSFGGGWYSALYFANTNTTPVSFRVYFVGNDGNLLNVPSLGGSSVLVDLAGEGAIRLEAPHIGMPAHGYVSLSLPSGVVGYGIVRHGVREAQVALASTTPTNSTLIWDDTTYVTTVSIVNPSPLANIVDVVVRDSSGALIGISKVPLSANGRVSQALRDLPGLSAITGNRGSADFMGETGAVAVSAVRGDGAAFTSIPVFQK
jgi:hypothetical protein